MYSALLYNKIDTNVEKWTLLFTFTYVKWDNIYVVSKRTHIPYYRIELMEENENGEKTIISFMCVYDYDPTMFATTSRPL